MGRVRVYFQDTQASHTQNLKSTLHPANETGSRIPWSVRVYVYDGPVSLAITTPPTSPPSPHPRACTKGPAGRLLTGRMVDVQSCLRLVWGFGGEFVLGRFWVHLSSRADLRLGNGFVSALRSSGQCSYRAVPPHSLSPPGPSAHAQRRGRGGCAEARLRPAWAVTQIGSSSEKLLEHFGICQSEDVQMVQVSCIWSNALPEARQSPSMELRERPRCVARPKDAPKRQECPLSCSLRKVC